MNMYDYLLWRGDLSFRQDPFNDVDNLLLSYAAYTDLREVLKPDQTVTVKMAAEAFFKFHTEEECLKSGSLIAHAPVILRRMGQTRRFGDLLISNYVREIDEEASQQFSAMHFLLDKRNTYIAFCGTDDTIVGWKEDFQMSYKLTNAQKRAAEYINATATQRFHHYLIGGHSKGGGLAVYGAMQADEAVRNRISKVWSNDGPGISSIAMDYSRFDIIKPKILKIIPELSVFGLLFDNHEKLRVIKSEKSGLYQHDAVGWMISGRDFVPGEISDDCQIIQEILNGFLNTMTLKEREELVDEMYAAFVNAGVTNTTDFTKKGIPVLLKFLKEITNLNENAREQLDKLTQVLMKIITDKAEETVIRKVKDVTEAIPELIKSVTGKKDTEEE